ncbi:baculoviral IAP repeat-containing protein 3-like [Portunus trituberculatus]|uniref:baculoviral IAP repeat-containing protein 3-like n=1 Tax=Portunus trituberculatus TaxID=210409 RepID=UPI001E1CFD6D|nr:baculoviral IAP repeat-containing protein 3-like [Portunus trituberculatus]
MQFDGLPVMKTPARAPEPRGERRFHSLKGLLLESVRRQTFVDWHVDFMDQDKLAQAGFFYLRTMDHVQCAFCRGIVGFWDEGDQPETEHKKHFPNCPFVTGVATGNIPADADPNTDEGQLYKMLNEFYAYKMANTRPSLPSAYQTDSMRVLDSPTIAYPHLNTSVSRLRTFSRWPKETRVDAEKLSDAGFFYTGLSDFVQCFHCGGGLFAWRAKDDPFANHARYYPHCSFIRMAHNVPNGAEMNGEANTLERPLTLSKTEAEMLLHHPSPQRLVTLGLSSVSVRETFKLCVEQRGFLCAMVTEALELVFDYDEKERQKQPKNQCHDGLPVPPSEPQEPSQEPAAGTSEASMEVEETKEPFFPPTPPPEHNGQSKLSDYSKLLQEVQALRQAVQVEERRLQCRMCGKEQVAVVFQPCSHLHLCADCARPRDSCITCGSVVRGTLRPIIG